MNSLSHYIAELTTDTKQIIIYGNFSIIKKNSSLPRHQVNTMGVGDFIRFALINGVQKNMGEICGYQVSKHTVGTTVVYMATNDTEARFILGAEDF